MLKTLFIIFTRFLMAVFVPYAFDRRRIIIKLRIKMKLAPQKIPIATEYGYLHRKIKVFWCLSAIIKNMFALLRNKHGHNTPFPPISRIDLFKMAFKPFAKICLYFIEHWMNP